MSIKSISYGGGVQSTAMIVLAVQGRIDADVALFANVGDDSEHPATLDYVREVMMPWAESQGFPVYELHRTRRDGSRYGGLLETIVNHDRDSLKEPIPVRGMNGAPLSRSCTVDWKVKVLGKWLKANGATADDPAQVNIGISTDEIQRVGNKKTEAWERINYPLIDLGLNRQDCMNVTADAGLPVPPKSSCWFCPFHKPQMWAEMRRDEPQLFAQSVELERLLNERRSRRAKDPVYLTGEGRPLDEAIPAAGPMLPIFPTGPDMDTCDSGQCWT